MVFCHHDRPPLYLHGVLEPAEEGGFIVTVPALPEVGTQGETYDEALRNAREAIELVIEDRLSRGEFKALL